MNFSTEPPAIFAENINDAYVREEKLNDKIETYAAFFRKRQVYIGIPVNHPWASMDDYSIPANCHGGITWSRDKLPDGTKRDNMWFIGWDYMHVCSMTEMFAGVSYGEIWDESQQDRVRTEAEKVIEQAVKVRIAKKE